MNFVRILCTTVLFTLLQACGGSDDPAPSGSASDPDAPVLSSIGNRTLLVNQTLNITLSATDPNGDRFDFTVNRITGIDYPFDFDATANPNIATWNNSDTFSWMPTATGVFQVKFTVTDQSQMSKSDSETITIAIYDSQALSIAAGGTLYSNNCESCHGANGSGGNELSVVSVDPRTLTDALGQTQGIPAASGMGGINLNADQIIAISAFLHSVAP